MIETPFFLNIGFLIIIPAGRDEDPVLKKNPDFGLYASNESRLLKSVLFCFYTFGVRHTIDVLDSENQPGSGKIRTGSGSLGDV